MTGPPSYRWRGAARYVFGASQYASVTNIVGPTSLAEPGLTVEQLLDECDEVERQRGWRGWQTQAHDDEHAKRRRDLMGLV